MPCKAQSSTQHGVLAVELCPSCPGRAPVSQHPHVLLSHHLPGQGLPRALPWHIHAQEHLPVIPATVTVGVPEDLQARETHIMSGSAPASPPTLRAALTLPFFCSLCLSFLLMCRSMLVSPRVMRAACHSVRAPRANATELGTEGTAGCAQAFLPWCRRCKGLRLSLWTHGCIGVSAHLIPCYRKPKSLLLCGPKAGRAGTSVLEQASPTPGR